MTTQTNWDVIIGAPSSGKTKLITYFSVLGYQTVPEVARTVIDVNLSYGKDLHSIRNPVREFQQKVASTKIAQELKLNPEQYLFLDTGVPCAIAYCNAHSTWLGPAISGKVSKYLNGIKYSHIFLLEPNPLEKDNARTETEDDRVNLYFSLRRMYRDLGYTVVEIPRGPIPERALEILKYRCSPQEPELPIISECLFYEE